MRYYKIVIENGPTFQSTLGDGGQNDSGALQVELDIFEASLALPSSSGMSYARIWGVPIQMIAQASQFNYKNIDVTVGMSAGLPLADPSQQGLVLHGSIYPAFGNWIGTEMTLDFVIIAPNHSSSIGPTPATQNNPANIVHNWQPGQPLSQAINSTLTTAFPSYTPQIDISPKLVLPYADVGFYRTFASYAGYIAQISRSIMGDPITGAQNYHGVQMGVAGKQIRVFDQTGSNPKTVTIAFKDLVGQPTWLGLFTIQVKTVMRGDIHVGDTLKLPQTLTVAAATTGSQFRSNSVFQGTAWVSTIRHVGNSRQPSGEAWVSIFDCIVGNNAPSGATPVGQGGIGGQV